MSDVDSAQKVDDNPPTVDGTKVSTSVEGQGKGLSMPHFLQRFSLVKIIILSVLCVFFITSVLLNITAILTFENPISFQSGIFSWIVIIGLIIVTSISLTIAFWTYYVRSIYIKDGPALVPEKWGSIIGHLIESSKIYHDESQMTLAQVKTSSENQAQKSSDLLENFLTLQKALDTRDDEISRLKNGYDAKIFKKILMRFIRIDRSLQELSQECQTKTETENYDYLSRIMQDALEECGVERFVPEIGSDYRDASAQISDNPVVLNTDDELQYFKIAGVNTSAYVLEGEGKMQVITPSKVSIFRFNYRKKEE